VVLPQERQQTLGEEIANSVSHGVALLAAMVAAPFLVVASVRQGDAIDIAGASVFAATMVLLYLTSMLYHALPATCAPRAPKACSRSWTTARSIC
jgi:hemolysin III